LLSEPVKQPHSEAEQQWPTVAKWWFHPLSPVLHSLDQSSKIEDSPHAHDICNSIRMTIGLMGLSTDHGRREIGDERTSAVNRRT